MTVKKVFSLFLFLKDFFYEKARKRFFSCILPVIYVQKGQEEGFLGHRTNTMEDSELPRRLLQSSRPKLPSDRKEFFNSSQSEDIRGRNLYIITLTPVEQELKTKPAIDEFECDSPTRGARIQN